MTASSDARSLLEATLKKLAAIGPRPHGSAGNDAAVAYVAERLRGLGFTVEEEAFTAPRPQARDAARLLIGDVPVACVPFLDSVDGRVRGRVTARGTCLVWGMHEWRVWTVEDGDARAAITQSSFPSAVQQHIPAELRGLPSVTVSSRDLGRRLDDPNVTVEVDVPTVLESTSGRSLRAFRGSDPLGAGSAASRPLVVAHIDTVPDCPGVYDNAAGVAAAISVCAADRPRDFQVLITNGEEEGLAGARAFAQRLAGVGSASIPIAIVLDGGGRGTVAEGWFSDERTESLLRPAFAATAERWGYETVARQPAPPAGDHAAFSEIGIPAVAYTVNDLEILHTPEDVYEDSKLASSELLAATAAASLDAVHPPS